jgi:purine-binding chemotaxis protein CheW
MRSTQARLRRQETIALEAPANEYLSFALGAELYAIGIGQVREIIEYVAPEPVPMMAPSMRGVINLRGSAVPVMDLALRFGRPPTGAGRRSCIIVLDLPAGAVGLMADAANEVIALAHGELLPPPAGSGAGAAVTGMARLQGKLEGRFILLLEGAALAANDNTEVVS